MDKMINICIIYTTRKDSRGSGGLRTAGANIVIYAMIKKNAKSGDFAQQRSKNNKGRNERDN